MMTRRDSFLGSAGAPRAGFGLAPKRTLPLGGFVPSCELQRKVRDREDALAGTRDACAPQMP
jgi:hypothetical protein